MKINHWTLIIITAYVVISCEKDTGDPVLYHLNENILLISIHQNDSKYLEFTYDSLNRLVQSDLYYTDTNYSRSTYSYDAENRLIGKSYDGYIETCEYDVDGLLKLLIKKYPSTDKVWKRVFIYENRKIAKAEIYFDDVQTDYAIYEYDANGNTAEMREYATNTDIEEFIMIYRKFNYDNFINPLYLIGFTPVDLIQVNNPEYTYYENALMCRGPTEYDATFEYDTNGLPLKELRTYKGSSQTDIFTYHYQSIEN